jgi:tRNA pseudouridine38-40 synthase
MDLSYDGTNYHGWQNQPNAISVQSCIEKALSLLIMVVTQIFGAGRTDTGVHAMYMCAHFDSNLLLDFSKFI